MRQVLAQRTAGSLWLATIQARQNVEAGAAVVFLRGSTKTQGVGDRRGLSVFKDSNSLSRSLSLSLLPQPQPMGVLDCSLGDLERVSSVALLSPAPVPTHVH